MTAKPSGKVAGQAARSSNDAAWLFVLLLNEIATALVYVLAAMLALFWSCGQ